VRNRHRGQPEHVVATGKRRVTRVLDNGRLRRTRMTFAENVVAFDLTPPDDDRPRNSRQRNNTNVLFPPNQGRHFHF
jgi:hypothetical protein